MLAGLIRDDERQSLDGIPGLSDLPLVGRLFAHTHEDDEQTDIILTLTPHIVRVLDLTEADLRPFRVGRDSLAPTELAGTDRRLAGPEAAETRAERPPTSRPDSRAIRPCSRGVAGQRLQRRSP